MSRRFSSRVRGLYPLTIVSSISPVTSFRVPICHIEPFSGRIPFGCFSPFLLACSAIGVALVYPRSSLGGVSALRGFPLSLLGYRRSRSGAVTCAAGFWNFSLVFHSFPLGLIKGG